MGAERSYNPPEGSAAQYGIVTPSLRFVPSAAIPPSKPRFARVTAFRTAPALRPDRKTVITGFRFATTATSQEKRRLRANACKAYCGS
jgi:hypothetical protein